MTKRDTRVERGSIGHDDLRWLLNFAALDLNSLTPGELLDLRIAAGRFATNISDGLITGPVPIDEAVEQLVSEMNRNPFEAMVATEFPVQALRVAQSELRQGLRILQAGEEWDLPQAPRTKLRLRRGAPSGIPVMRFYIAPLIELQFIARVADVLVGVGWTDVRVCAREGCGTQFVPVRRQVYCSTTCAQRTKWERFAKRKPRRRNYHAEYEARVKRRQPRAKVARQARRTKG